MLKKETLKDLYHQQLQIMNFNQEEIDEILSYDFVDDDFIDDSFANIIRLFSTGDFEELNKALIYTQMKLALLTSPTTDVHKE